MSDPDLTRDRVFSKRSGSWDDLGPFTPLGRIRLLVGKLSEENERLEENLKVLSPWRPGSNDISNTYNGGEPIGYFVNDPWAEMYDDSHCDRCGELLRPWDFKSLCTKCERDMYYGEHDPSKAFQIKDKL